MILRSQLRKEESRKIIMVCLQISSKSNLFVLTEGVDNDKFVVEDRDKAATEAIAKTSKETDFAKRELVYNKFRAALQHQIRLRIDANISNKHFITVQEFKQVHQEDVPCLLLSS